MEDNKKLDVLIELLSKKQDNPQNEFIKGLMSKGANIIQIVLVLGIGYIANNMQFLKEAQATGEVKAQQRDEKIDQLFDITKGLATKEDLKNTVSPIDKRSNDNEVILSNRSDFMNQSRENDFETSMILKDLTERIKKIEDKQ